MLFDTHSVRVELRSRYWCEELRRALHIAVSPLAGQCDPIVATAVWEPLGDGTLAEVRGEPHGIASCGRGESEDRLTIIAPVEGLGVIEQDGQAEAMAPDRLYLIDSTRSWKLQPTRAFRHLVLSVPGAVAPRLRSLGRLRLPNVVPGVAALFADLAKSTVDRAPELDEAARRSIGTSLLALACCGLDGGREDRLDARDGDATRRRVHAVAQRYLHEPGLNVESVARLAGVSVRRVHALYADSSSSLMRWIWNERLDRCHRALADANLAHRSVSEIAFEHGFNSAAHFSRAFRARFGMTPRQHRLRSWGDRVDRDHHA